MHILYFYHFFFGERAHVTVANISMLSRAMRMIKQKRPLGRPRANRPDERHGGGGGSHGRGPGHHHHARPRGLSDANQSQPGSSVSTSADLGQSVTNGNSTTTTQSHANGTTTPSEGSVRTTISRQSSKKSSLGRTSDLDPVFENFPSPGSSFSIESKPDHAQNSLKDRGSDDEDEFDLELLGFNPASPFQELTWSSTALSRASYNARPYYSQYTPNPPDSEDYYFGTQPDLSPLTSSFPPPEKPAAFHLPYPSVYRPSRSASFSDTPSIPETPPLTQAAEWSSHSSGSLSTHSANSSVPVTPLTPALAEIVDAVAKVAVTAPSSEWRLSRRTSLQSINEHNGHDDGSRKSVDSEQSLSNFPVPPQNLLPSKHQLLRIKTSLSNISEVESTRSQDWLRVDTTISASPSPGESLSSFDFPTSPRSLSGKISFDRLSSSDRRSSLTPVPQSGGGLARLLRPRRSGSRLEKEIANARNKAEKLEQSLEKEDKASRKQDKSDRESTQYLSGLWSPKSPRSSKSDDKKRKKELEKQKIRGITEEAKLSAEKRSIVERWGSEKWAVSGVGGL